ncbi:Helicase PriA essential for oriC/DnaA-independent DNA replication [hydrothermal vent metagenome]|uniref:DNA 3'-5' helicase n=1 Tax=hydrothermal vent metagenome TaxID=652676 RepID=A0A3B1C5I6_9ZZZZ
MAVPGPLRRIFDYLPPSGCTSAQLQPGMRLRIPFGQRVLVGVLLEVTDHSELAMQKLRRAEALLDSRPILPQELLALMHWASRYYQHSIGEVILGSLPTLLRQGQAAQATTETCWQLSPAGQKMDPCSLQRAPKQAALLGILQQYPSGLDAQLLNQQQQNWRPSMARLQQKGWVTTHEREYALTPPVEATPSKTAPPTLNRHQQAAVETISARLDRYQCYLLNGITGSGKTEVYLQLIKKVLAAGRQVLVLAPEIGLTPQLIQRFHERLSGQRNGQIALLHSRLTDQARLDNWLACAAGKAGVLIGTRSALFTPMPNLGLIILDEEHDLSFKQQDSFRYNARDLAIVRAQKADIPVILGSATPSLESLHNVAQQRSQMLLLPERAGNAQRPQLRLLDIRHQKLEQGLSAQLLSRVQHHLDDEGQVLLFINRRGYAPVLMCHDCGWHARCLRCDAHMTVHHRQQQLRCHHCGSQRPVNRHCPDCNSDSLHFMGAGTERVEDSLAARFPNIRVLRIDRDSTRRKGSLDQKLAEIQRGTPIILVGTQMLAKGHHFPNVTLVGMLDADYGLFSADFRASERMGQLLLQVAGRAGRAERTGEVLIQTHQPDNPLLHFLLRHDYSGFSRTLLRERAEAQLPPYSHLALLRAESPEAEAAMQFLQQAKQQAARIQPQLLAFGPLPAPMERRAGRFRAQLLFQHHHRGELQQWLAQLMPPLENMKSGRKVRWSIDVDPMEMY